MSAPKTIKRSDLQHWVGTGELKDYAYKKALDFFRDGKAWNRWALVALFALGVGHILAGIIFFFAFNWNDLSPVLKFSVVQGGLIVSAGLWMIFRLDHIAGQAFGIASTVLVGVLLAVFGQVFQTPAAIYTPFVLWAGLTLPFAVVSKSVAHWAVWMAIALVGALTFIGDGLTAMIDKDLVRLAYLGVALILLGTSALYHYFSHSKFLWAKTRWFRLSLVLAAFGILFCIFTEDFWIRETGFVWGLALIIAGGALFVAYKKLPTLPTLSLMTFFLAMMVAQFGFRVIFDFLEVPDIISGSLIRMLLTFVWMAGITFVLAKAFRHYQDKFGIVDDELLSDTPDIVEKPRTISDFITHMNWNGGDLNTDAVNPDDGTPWYVDVLLGLSGIITAIFAALFVASIVALFFRGDPFLPSLIAGLIAWGGALLLRVKTTSKFARHFFNTLMIGGGAVVLVSLGREFDGGAMFILGSLALILITFWKVRDRIIEFLMALSLFGLAAYILEHYNVPRPYIGLCLLFIPLGAAALVWPLKKRVYYAAGSALLFSVPVAGLAYYYKDTIFDKSFNSDWLEMIVSLGVTILVVAGLNMVNSDDTEFQPPAIVLVPLLAAMAFMPAGSAAALLTVIVGYILGSRAIALIGVVMQIYFLFLFYYDLQISLLSKSILLLISGSIFVGMWYVFRNRAETAHA